MSAVDLLGWVGSAAFAACAVPQAWKTWKSGKADDLSTTFLILWIVGEASMIACVLLGSLPLFLLVNYAFNALSLSVICWVKWRR